VHESIIAWSATKERNIHHENNQEEFNKLHSIVHKYFCTLLCTGQWYGCLGQQPHFIHQKFGCKSSSHSQLIQGMLCPPIAGILVASSPRITLAIRISLSLQRPGICNQSPWALGTAKHRQTRTCIRMEQVVILCWIPSVRLVEFRDLSVELM
jgi:hypothetical protein